MAKDIVAWNNASHLLAYDSAISAVFGGGILLLCGISSGSHLGWGSALKLLIHMTS